MENFEKVVIGLVLFVVTSIVAYLFRMRQLYAAAVPVPAPTTSSQSPEITFSLKCGDEFLYGLIYTVESE